MSRISRSRFVSSVSLAEGMTDGWDCCATPVASATSVALHAARAQDLLPSQTTDGTHYLDTPPPPSTEHGPPALSHARVADGAADCHTSESADEYAGKC